MRLRTLFSVLLAGLFAQASARADLITYVAKPDTNWKWELVNKTENPLGTVYDLHLVSQVWQGETWEHGLQVFVPKGTKPTETMFLWNQGGKPSNGSSIFGLTIASKVKAPVAFLFGIPKQPLFEGKKEDALIAETFVRYLETKDADWPLLFPMTKSLIRAMDALQAFSEKEWNHKTTGFVVSGASKRGWTTWLTGAADSRVKAIAPLVIDTLNFPEQLPHQVKSFGTYSEQIADYTQRGLVPLPNTDLARQLWRMTDPYTFREKMTMPKYILTGANDPYWTVDATNFYWDGLKGDKWACRVPNAGHNLEQKTADGQIDRNRAVDSLSAFGRSQIYNKPMAKATWTITDSADKSETIVTASAAPKAARTWVVDAPTRDFRKATWVEKPASVDGMKCKSEVEMPKTGCRAYYTELDYDIDGLVYRICSQVRVLANEKAP